MILANRIMKTIIKKIGYFVLSLAFVGGLLGASVVFAASSRQAAQTDSAGNNPAASAGSGAGSNATGNVYCDKVTGLLAGVGQKLNDFNGKLQQVRAQIATKLQNAEQTRDQNLQKVRQQWADNQQEQFAKLEEMAQTESQKQAAIKFETEVKAAVKTRQQAVDAAIKSYRSGLDKIVATRKTSADAAKTALKNAAQAAANNASATCKAGTDPQVMRQNLQDSLKQAREQYASAVQAMEQNRIQTMQQLKSARQEAVQNAVNQFQITMEQLRAELKTALGQTSDSGDGTSSTTDSAQPAQ